MQRERERERESEKGCNNDTLKSEWANGKKDALRLIFAENIYPS